MKKWGILFALTILFSLNWLEAPQKVYGDDSSSSSSMKEENLISDIKFDKETRVFSGKTAPFSNIYLSETAINISADENGHFEFTVDSAITEANVTISDIIGNQSTEFAYDFNEAKMETIKREKKTSSTNAANSDSLRNSNPLGSIDLATNGKSAADNKEQVDSENDTAKVNNSSSTRATEKNAQPKFFSAILILIFLLAIGSVITLAILRKKKQEMQQKKRMRKRKRKKSKHKKRKPHA